MDEMEDRRDRESEVKDEDMTENEEKSPYKEPFCKTVTFSTTNYRPGNLMNGVEALLYKIYGVDKYKGILVLDGILDALREEYKDG